MDRRVFMKMAGLVAAGSILRPPAGPAEQLRIDDCVAGWVGDGNLDNGLVLRPEGKIDDSGHDWLWRPTIHILYADGEEWARFRAIGTPPVAWHVYSGVTGTNCDTSAFHLVRGEGNKAIYSTLFSPRHSYYLNEYTTPTGLLSVLWIRGARSRTSFLIAPGVPEHYGDDDWSADWTQSNLTAARHMKTH